MPRSNSSAPRRNSPLGYIEQWMKNNQVSEELIASWVTHFTTVADKNAVSLISRLCQYHTLLTEKNGEKIPVVRENIKNNTEFKYYFRSKELYSIMASICANLHSEDVFLLAQKNQSPLMKVLYDPEKCTADQEPEYTPATHYRPPEGRKEEFEADTTFQDDYILLQSKSAFLEFLNHLNLDETSFQSHLYNTNNPKDIVDFLLTPRVLGSYNMILKMMAPIDDPDPALANLLSQQMRSQCLNDLKKLYKTSKRNTNNFQYTYQPDTNDLTFLKKYEDEFRKLIEKNQLANQILYTQNNFDSLINILESHSQLNQQLDENKIEQIIEDAKRYLSNAKSDILLYTIAAGLPIKVALSYRSNMKDHWQKWHDALNTALQRDHTNKQSDYQTIVVGRIKVILDKLGDDAYDESLLVKSLSDEKKIMHSSTLNSFVDAELFSQADIMDLSSHTRNAFVDVVDELDQYQSILSSGSNYHDSFADIIAENTQIKAFKEYFHQVKESTSEESVNELLEKYAKHILNTAKDILCNVKSQKMLLTSLGAGLSFEIAITSPSDQHSLLKEKYRGCLKIIERKIPSFLLKSGVKEGLDIFKLIVHNNEGIQPVELYARAYKILTSRIVKYVCEQQWLKVDYISTIASSNDQEYERLIVLRKRIEELPLEYQQCFNRVVQHDNFCSTEQLTQTAEKIFEYLDSPLLRKIIQDLKVNSDQLADEIIQSKQADTELENEWLINLEQKIQNSGNSKALYKLFSNAYQLDEDSTDFSFKSMNDYITHYLDSINSDTYETLVAANFDRAKVIVSSTHDQETALEQYNQLSSLLAGYDASNALPQCIEKSHKEEYLDLRDYRLENICQKLELTQTSTLFSSGISGNTLVRLSTQIINELYQLQQTLSQTLPLDKDRLKDFFVDFDNHIVHLKYSQSRIERSIDMLSCRSTQLIITSTQCNPNSFLASDLELIRELDGFMQGENITQLLKCADYSIEQLLAEIASTRQQSINEYVKTAHNYFKRLVTDERVNCLVRQGVKPISALTLEEKHLRRSARYLKAHQETPDNSGLHNQNILDDMRTKIIDCVKIINEKGRFEEPLSSRNYSRDGHYTQPDRDQQQTSNRRRRRSHRSKEQVPQQPPEPKTSKVSSWFSRR